jgi:hypothetical protein
MYVEYRAILNAVPPIFHAVKGAHFCVQSFGFLNLPFRYSDDRIHNSPVNKNIKFPALNLRICQEVAFFNKVALLSCLTRILL